MQYTEISSAVKIENFVVFFFVDIFLIFAQNIDCGYSLEPPCFFVVVFLPPCFFFFFFAQNIDCRYKLEQPHRGGSNEYPQSMFWCKNKKNRYTPAYPNFAT